MFGGEEGFMVHTRTHAHTKKTFLPVILVRLYESDVVSSVKEVNAEIETLDHRKKMMKFDAS